MGFNADTERKFTFKKIFGKATTSPDKEIANEGLASGVTIAAQNVFGQSIPATPTKASLYDITDSRIEYLRLSSSFIPGTDTSDGRHAFGLQLPDDYEARSSNPKAGTDPYVNGKIIYVTSGALQLVPTSFGADYESKPYHLSGGETLIPPLDARDWLLDYFNGVFFQQDPPGTGAHAQNPSYVDAFLYIGDFLGPSSGGGSGDPNAAYVVMSATGSLTNERVLAAGTGLIKIDGGAGNNVTLSINDSTVATISGSAFTGGVKITNNLRVTGTGSFDTGISGSLTHLTDGSSYLIAGSNVTITSASNGAVTIASSGGGSGSGTNFFTSPAAGKINTTGSAVFAGGELGASYVATTIGTDIFFFVSGTIGSKDTAVTGSAVFGGDVVVSGSLNAPFGISGSLTRLTNDTSYLVAGDNITINSASNGQVTINAAAGGGGGTGDPNATYLVMSATGSLNAERVLTAGTGINLVDAGANANATLNINDSVVATLTGSIFSGVTQHTAGLSGSLTQLTDGTSYLTAGSNITILSASSGGITISSTGGSGGTTTIAGLLIREIADRNVNGSTTTFYLTGSPEPDSTVGVYINGLLMMSGSSDDYLYAPATNSVTFSFTPPAGGNVQFEYSSGSNRTTGATASGLETATSTIEIGGSDAPVSGSILVARSATEAIWQPAMVFGEQPSGTKDGSNVTFNLVRAPINGTDLMLFVNGIYQTSGSVNDYELTGSIINFSLAPLSDDTVNSIYRPSY
jgi:hypothetical protein